MSSIFESPERLLLGLLTGLLFGFLLQKGLVAKYRVIVGQFLLKDFTVAKVMLTAIVVGGIGVYAMLAMGMVQLHLKALHIGGVLVGGLLFGAGMAIFGYCPGTSVAACGEGRRDAMVGVLGMLAGAGIFVATWPAVQPLIEAGGYGEKVTFPDLTGISAWIWLASLAVLGLAGRAVRKHYRDRGAMPQASRERGGQPRPGPTQLSDIRRRSHVR